MTKKNEPIRLQLYLARSGVASRRASERLIEHGSVSVNGQIVTRLGTKVLPTDDVRVDGKRVRIEQRSVYVALNKPRRYLCSAHDPEGRPLAVSLLEPHYEERLFSVGRLDFLSSGLIFYTNDGEFARVVAHPSNQVEKEYRVDAQKPIPNALLEEYQRGIVVDGETYRLDRYQYRTPRSVRLTLTEGRNREIRRVFAHWRIGVRRIHRVRIGIVKLKDIPSGQYRPLSQKEVDWFFARQRGRS
ncbi:MAG: pseudouridine synthase [Spirochaetota bacterium]